MPNPAQTLSSLLNAMNKMQDLESRAPPGLEMALQDPYLKENVFPKLQAQGQKKAVMGDLLNYMTKYAGHKGLATGPIVGKYWKTVPSYTGTQEELEHPWISAIANLVSPKEADIRRGMEQRIRQLGEAAFPYGGKQLTGTELATLYGPNPSMLMPEEQFQSSMKENLQTYIPRSVEALKRGILGRGINPEVTDQLIQQFMNERQQ